MRKKLIEDLQELRYLQNENLTKTQVIKTITESLYLPSTLSAQSSTNTKEPYNMSLEMAYNCTISLTKNNKSKPSDSQTGMIFYKQ